MPTKCLLCLAIIATASVAFGQGAQVGTITGIVRSADGIPVPQVSVTAKSPTLQGERRAVTDVNGVYFIKGLPAGTYTVSFSMAAFQTANQDDVQLPVGGTAEVNPTLQLAARTEQVNVTAQTPAPIATTTVAQTFRKQELDALPVGRRPQDVAELAPNLTNNTPNASQVTIGGATAFDNVFLMNGVDINDNLFGTPHGLYIEDAIQEMNILTGGISAEWGRFTGGVINVVTKSGGNTFSGGFRENFSNPNWIDETPRERANNITHKDILSKSHEGVFGGPIVRDRLWFFSAARYENADTPLTFVQTPASATRHDTNKRGEVKGTTTVAPGQAVTVDYINNSTQQNNRFSLNANSMDPSVLVNEQQPNSLFVSNYNGTLGGRYFMTLQYSQKKFEFQNAGGTNTAITASPFRSRGILPGVSSTILQWNAPYFSALDPEDRDNHQFTGSVSRTISRKGLGTHDFKGGGEYYRTTRTGGNSQSATGYVFRTDYVVSGGVPLLDAQGVPIPVFQPGVTRLQNWIASVGAVLNINSTSLYFQDHWVATPHLSLDLGTRFEAVRSHATGDIVAVDTTNIVPRLGVSYDLHANGMTILQATYGHYAGRYTETLFGSNSDVGNPSLIQYEYTGPTGTGKDFAPGFDLKNYTTISAASFPTGNISTASGLHSPTVREFTLAAGRQLGPKGDLKVTYAFRRWYNFVDDFISLSNGLVTVTRNGATVGPLTRSVYSNTDAIHREYQALVVQHNYHFAPNTTWGASYTLQIRNNGNFNGEAANQPGITSVYGDYPEVIGSALARYLPDGRLADYQRHKLRVYGIYRQDMGRFGSVDVSPLWRVNSGQVYSLFAPAVRLSPIELARNPGYPSADVSASRTYDLFYGARGSQDFKGYGVLDLSATYQIPVWKALRPWMKVEIYNILDNEKQIAWDTSVTPDPNSPLDANGLPTGYIKAASFGTATNDNQFAQPVPGTNGGRLFRLAFGFRF
jgi:hypothetical protein